MAGITVVLGAPWLRQHSRAFALLVKNLLDNMVKVNRVSLATDKRIPMFYQSGVYYQEEPDGYDSFVDVYKVLESGHGDCAHLCAWRLAELQNNGEKKAGLNIEWRDWSDEAPGTPKLFHVRIRRADGRIEDPSKVLGMGARG